VSTLRAVLEAFANSHFVDEDCPFPSRLALTDSRVAILTGANATGKSLVFRHLAAFGKKVKLSPMTLSIRERTGAGGSGMLAAFIFGDEQQQSTGATSVGVAICGFANVRSRLEATPPVPSLLMFDEPEMGLSQGYAMAMGIFLAQQVMSLPAQAPGLIVVSHSRSLVRKLAETLDQPPSFIHMGEKPQTLSQWLETEEVCSVDALMSLEDIGRRGAHAFGDWQRKIIEETRMFRPPPKVGALSQMRQGKWLDV
jgi:hypothetical protein